MEKTESSRYLEVYERAKKYFQTPGVVKSSYRLFRVGLGDRYYVDFDMIINDLLQCKDIVFLYKSVIEGILKERSIDFLGFIEKSSGGTIGAIRLAGAISLSTRIPNIPIRLGKELPFEKVKIPQREGKSPKEKKIEDLNVTLVIDHCTTGDEALQAIDIIEKNGGKVTDVVAYSVRTDKLRWNRFKQKKVMFHYLYDASPVSMKELGLEIQK